MYTRYPKDMSKDDPWERRLNPTNWSYTNVPDLNKHAREFTGYAQYDQFDLINMNGKVYDSPGACFLSPDILIQDKTHTQRFNRYSYTVNNPLKYTDPSGYKLGRIAMAEMDDRYEGIGPRRGGGGGISWPRFGTLNGPSNSFEADVMLAGQLYELGFTDAYQELNHNIGLNQYSLSDMLNSRYSRQVKLRLERYHIENTSDPNSDDYDIEYVSTGMRRVWYFDAANQGGSDYAWAGVLAFAGTAVIADGPIPIGDAIGAATLAAYGSYVLADKMAAEISRIAEKVNNTRGFVYELRVNQPGTFINVRGVPTQMNAGDVWKYGETTKGFGRYSQSTIDNLIPGGVSMFPIFQGNVVEIKIQEKIMIYDYFMMNGHLPPGNKIFR